MADDRLEVAPQSEITPAAVSLSAEVRQRFAESICDAYDQSLSDRSGRDYVLRVADRNYEMEVEPRVYPWPGASNLFVPIIPEQVDSVVANTVADVIVPNMFLILGLDEVAAQTQHKVQAYYNSRLTARRGLGMQTWLQEAQDYIHLAALHGTGYMDVTYLRKTVKRKYALVTKNQTDDGTDVLDPETGEASVTSEIREVSITEYDDVLWEALEEREVILVPARAKSVQEAHTRIRIMYYTEAELMALSRPKKNPDDAPPLFDRKAVLEIIHGTIADGDSERISDPRGLEHLDIGGQIETQSVATANTVDGRLKSTEYEVLRVDTEAYSLTPDGDAEHLMMWVHRNPRVTLGVMRFPYHHNRCTLVPAMLMRRPRRAYGRGVPEILRTIQVDANANANMRKDSQTLKMLTPRRQDPGVKILGGDNGEWGPNVTFIGPKDSVELLQLGDILPSSEREDDRLNAFAGRLTGQSSLATGALSSKRTTKAEVQAAGRGQSNRQNMMSTNIRYAFADILYLTHELTKQYGPQQLTATMNPTGNAPRKITLSKDELSLDYDLLVAGMGGPQDRDGDRQDVMLLHQMFVNPQRPDIMNNPVRRNAFDRLVLDALNRGPEATALIGSQEDAQQELQQQQQQQAAMAAQQQQQAAQGQQPGKPGQQQQHGGPPQPPQGGGGFPSAGMGA